ncbi:UDP-N-acetylmuramoyl-tripeptide--D-alanyl-D-alanine ligase [Ferrovum myxofaciens]|uniref:UDP-N-acetylmuramoyl-tripeptide--D-alanyl-D-alanine ligase n=1 Tax=Ferrovum myxofaciens TaxID=416213 RepID=A0A9E6MW71_9PROT|nr:UDP-N-acetylmuramoyl-tripeptide--D-alanyl-D-alanine ligase [Ferrovum myxofaciens]MBU6994669.1 UDP-N-acetylmuramoyl-tripeptide--D-alanyl-D-alanine ligase [Ferrovum myxofaciens]QKE38521.1 MAG: UDP-N-acetylmuramoyl-tripeptide--D-alanyl-D-alanine ligase [Ferrovum myxofaciens]QWY73712.1 MAG: UDP-N-acetylmuramoyl-tripeptide--D-alanyl-D-alanine ligase [Ferrovum myxofaciens]QWY76466.1 MAG: UDP-N-acetylmuramoyl-tripeptide--D-alanyl-D-alanine ligase [Ferrovum myxofaciens]
MNWTWHEVVHLLGGVPKGSNPELLRITTDSRDCGPGDLFIAIKGEFFDGHDFLGEVRTRGVAGAIIERDVPAVQDWDCCWQTDSTRVALAQLARARRRQVDPRVVAVTGSNGKTTVKEMVAAILRASDPAGAQTVWATPGNFNNDIGLPLTLLALRPEHRWAVIEMGMNHAGEIARLTRIAEPEVAVVTNIQRAHLGHLGSLAEIARAKGEIFEGLGVTGVAVLPENGPYGTVLRSAAAPHKMLTFGFEEKASVRGESERGLLRIRGSAESVTVRLQVPGRHNQENALAATAVALALGVNMGAVQRGLENFAGMPGRLQSRFSSLGALILDDTYNANPDSVQAALEVLAQRPGRRIFVLGDLGELGPEGPALHAEVGQLARTLGIDEFYTLGNLAREASLAFGPSARHETETRHLIQVLRPQLNADTVVLVKGSRFMGMEAVVEGLIQ